MDIQIGDILEMKKAHPCGEKRWQVLRTGADFRLKCLGCGHEVMTPRFMMKRQLMDSAAAFLLRDSPSVESP